MGGGLSGLSTAYLLGKSFPAATIDVFEKEHHAGGTIDTVSKGGFNLEIGPNGFLSSKPSTLQLVSELGLEVLSANKAAEKRFVYFKGQLQELPDSPKKFLGSKLLPWTAKLRIMMEPFIRSKRGDKDETIAAFGQRRLGREAVKTLLDPMVSGVFAGNVNRLSIASCFPRMVQLEKEYGSLVKAMFRLKAKKVSPKGSLLSFKGGMKTLINALVDSKLFALHLDTPVTEIQKSNEGYRINAGKKLYDILIMACPVHQLVKLKSALLAPLQSVAASIVYPPVHVIHFSVPKGKTAGFGFLIPSVLKYTIMGALFSDNIFADRAPSDQSIVTVLMGGDNHHEVSEWSDDMIIEVAKADMMETMGLSLGDVTFLHLVKWSQSIPQYYVGHKEKVKAMKHLCHQNKGLYMTGNSWYGIGINDCTQASYNLVETIKDTYK